MHAAYHLRIPGKSACAFETARDPEFVKRGCHLTRTLDTPVAGDGKIYFTSEEGDVHVLQAGPEYKLLATNKMGEICMATPAISEGNLFFRTQGHVVAIGRLP